MIERSKIRAKDKEEEERSSEFRKISEAGGRYPFEGASHQLPLSRMKPGEGGMLIPLRVPFQLDLLTLEE